MTLTTRTRTGLPGEEYRTRRSRRLTSVTAFSGIFLARHPPPGRAPPPSQRDRGLVRRRPRCPSQREEGPMRNSPEPQGKTNGRSAEVAALLTAARAVLENRAFTDAARAVLVACKAILGADAGFVAVTLAGREGHRGRLPRSRQPRAPPPLAACPCRFAASAHAPPRLAGSSSPTIWQRARRRRPLPAITRPWRARCSHRSSSPATWLGSSA